MAPIRLDFDKYRFSAPLNALERQKPQESATARDGAGVPMNNEDSATPTSSTRSGNDSDEASYDSCSPDIVYPVDINARAKYKTRVGKRLTPYQWKVYDFLLTIPSGKVTTYKGVAQAVGGSPRSAGTALRSNPFSPYVPCHRVIASDLFVGGFFGEWAKGDEGNARIDQKRALLAEEGVLFDPKGYLCERGQLL